MTYAHALDWAATFAGIVLCAFFVGAGGVLAWHDRRGPAHRLPLLALVCAMGLVVAFSSASWLLLKPYHVGSAWWAQAAAYVVVGVSGYILWHGFGTCLKGLVPKRVDAALESQQPSVMAVQEEAATRLTLGA